MDRERETKHQAASASAASMQRERRRRPVAPRLVSSTAAAAAADASVKLLIHPHARQTIAVAAHRNPTARPPARPATDRPRCPSESALRTAVKMHSPCPHVVDSRQQRLRRPSNARYRQPPPPCLVINRSRDTIRSSQGSSGCGGGGSSSSSSRAGAAQQSAIG